MIKLVEKLKEIMDNRFIRREEASRIIGCANRTLYYWLNDECDPQVRMQRKILDAMLKMRLQSMNKSGE